MLLLTTLIENDAPTPVAGVPALCDVATAAPPAMEMFSLSPSALMVMLSPATSPPTVLRRETYARVFVLIVLTLKLTVTATAQLELKPPTTAENAAATDRM